MMRSMSAGREPGARQRPRGGAGSQADRRLALAGDIALPDAGALDDPVVGGVDPARQFVVGDGALGQAGANPPHHGTEVSRSSLRLSGTGERRRAGLARMADHVADIGEQILAHHVVTDLDSAGVALGVGPAMALDDYAVKAKEDGAVGAAGIELAPERLESRRAPADSRSAWRASPPSPRAGIGRSAGRCLRPSSARYCR